ncbi:hypothetical protein TrispH2_011495 [Trichoplax sp. H2]|nr:hypothetical protein TrispH2_011495 [Trichoplax sp. H2]|eukprot:RDD36301.1 hypothetical protein TrispH2_011495 [Trichoplax sp. H2]
MYARIHLELVYCNSKFLILIFLQHFTTLKKIMTRRFYRYNFLHFWIFIFYLGSCHRLISASN